MESKSNGKKVLQNCIVLPTVLRGKNHQSKEDREISSKGFGEWKA